MQEVYTLTQHLVGCLMFFICGAALSIIIYLAVKDLKIINKDFLRWKTEGKTDKEKAEMLDKLIK